MVFHPKAELIGTDLAATTDPSGKRLSADMVAVVKASGGGFVPYLWSKAGVEQPVAKISYVQGFAPWGWIIGSGIYADDTATQLQPTLARLLAGVAIAAALIAILAALIGRGVTRPVRDLTGVMEKLASGDLDCGIPKATRVEEIGRMTGAVQVFKDNLPRTRQIEAETAQDRIEAEERRKADLRRMIPKASCFAMGRLEIGERVDALTLAFVATSAWSGVGYPPSQYENSSAP